MLDCPSCGGKTKPRNNVARGDSVLRYRSCLECGFDWKTIEIDEDIYQHLVDMKMQQSDHEWVQEWLKKGGNKW